MSAPAASTVSEALRDARRRLIEAPFEPSTREATLLMAYVLDVDEVVVLAHPERDVLPDRLHAYRSLIERRLEGEPVAYLTGERDFFGRRFRVDRRVLIPRPETEHLVEMALELDLPANARALDVGTGSGCLALTLAQERPAWRIVATDRSAGAIAIARHNRSRLGCEDRVRLLCTDLVGGLELDRLDLIVSNPPYVSRSDIGTLSKEILDYEPALALFAEENGTATTKRLLRSLLDTRPGTRVLLEIGAGQAEEIARASAESSFHLLEIRADYAGIPRVAHLERT